MLLATLMENLQYEPNAGGARFGPEAGSVELCPLEEGPQGEVNVEENLEEPGESEPSQEFVSLAGEAFVLPDARGANEAAPPSEEEVKTRELTRVNYQPWR